MKIPYVDFEKNLKANHIGITTDGIGNCDIHYIHKTKDGRRELSVTIGGYCDMEPFKWSIDTGWKVKGLNSKKKCWGQAWDIISTRTKYVDYSGGEYDKAAQSYMVDSEYLDLLLEAKEKLVKKIVSLDEESKKIFETINDDNYNYKVEKVFTTKKWVGHLTYRGQQHKTKPCATFFEAKEELDSILNHYHTNVDG